MKAKLILYLMLFNVSLIYGQNTIIPDPNFEQRLIDMGYDSGVVNGFVPTSNINTVTSLVVPNSNISDLTGIEDFTALTNLDCIGNPISSLDLSSNSALVHLYTGTNQIANLNVSNNLVLETLVCSGNQLTTLDVSNNTALKVLRCRIGLLNNLDLSNNIALETLNCSDNFLTTLNLKNGSNGLLTSMSAENNSLNCIGVDDEIAANAKTGVYNSWIVDASIYYSEDCSSCPEMDIIGNTISILSGDITPSVADNTDFGIVNFGNFEDRTFTIENTGIIDLNLTGMPLITISNSTDFTITNQPSAIIVANGGSTSFVVRYTPSSAGTINTATLNIANDDCNENPYTFNVVGQSDSALNMTENDLLNNLVHIYPNPNNGNFILSYYGKEKLQEMLVFDTTGKRVLTISFDNFNFRQEINLNVSKGIYFLKVKSKNIKIKKVLLVN